MREGFDLRIACTVTSYLETSLNHEEPCLKKKKIYENNYVVWPSRLKALITELAILEYALGGREDNSHAGS